MAPNATITELYYVGKVTKYESGKYRRTDGQFYIVPKNFICSACSGRWNAFCLPDESYRCHTFSSLLPKGLADAMTRDGVGFYVKLSDVYDPVKAGMRDKLLIHPDGGEPGTGGCIGIIDKVAECRNLLKELFPNENVTRYLKVITLGPKDVFPATVDKLPRLAALLDMAARRR